jgi:hypothetical protein
MQGIVTEGEVSLRLTSLYWLVQINCVSYWNYIFLFCKTTYLNEDVNCTEPSPSVRFPWILPPMLTAAWYYKTGVTTFGIKIHSIMTFSITTLSIKGLFATFSKATLWHYARVAFYLSLCWLSLCWVLVCWTLLYWMSLCWKSWHQELPKNCLWSLFGRGCLIV